MEALKVCSPGAGDVAMTEAVLDDSNSDQEMTLPAISPHVKQPTSYLPTPEPSSELGRNGGNGSNDGNGNNGMNRGGSG